jgi:hypothetical protein
MIISSAEQEFYEQIRYLENNPLEAELVANAWEYRWLWHIGWARYQQNDRRLMDSGHGQGCPCHSCPNIVLVAEYLSSS